MPAKSRPLRITITPHASYDIDATFAFANEHGRQAAVVVARRIYNAVERLGEFPQLGALLPQDDAYPRSADVRFIVIEPYLIFYRVLPDEVLILRVLHARQDSLGLLFE